MLLLLNKQYYPALLYHLLILNYQLFCLGEKGKIYNECNKYLVDSDDFLITFIKVSITTYRHTVGQIVFVVEKKNVSASIYVKYPFGNFAI